MREDSPILRTMEKDDADFVFSLLKRLEKTQYLPPMDIGLNVKDRDKLLEEMTRDFFKSEIERKIVHPRRKFNEDSTSYAWFTLTTIRLRASVYPNKETREATYPVSLIDVLNDDRFLNAFVVYSVHFQNVHLSHEESVRLNVLHRKYFDVQKELKERERQLDQLEQKLKQITECQTIPPMIIPMEKKNQKLWSKLARQGWRRKRGKR